MFVCIEECVPAVSMSVPESECQKQPPQKKFQRFPCYGKEPSSTVMLQFSPSVALKTSSRGSTVISLRKKVWLQRFQCYGKESLVLMFILKIIIIIMKYL